MKRTMTMAVMAAGALALWGGGEGVAGVMAPEAAAQEAPDAARQDRMRGPGRGWGMMRGPGVPPLARLLEQREALGLTAEQVSRLEALAARAESDRAALRERLEEVRGDRPAPRERARSERPRLSEEE